MNNRLTKFTKYLLDFLFFAGIVLLIMLPGVAKWYSRVYPKLYHYYYVVLFLFISAGVFCLMIVYELRKMFVTVLDSRPFIRENQYSLKKIGCLSFMISIFLTPFVFLIFRAAVIAVVFVFVIAGLFCFVLSQLFEQAVNYKEENDLTI